MKRTLRMHSNKSGKYGDFGRFSSKMAFLYCTSTNLGRNNYLVEISFVYEKRFVTEQ